MTHRASRIWQLSCLELAVVDHGLALMGDVADLDFSDRFIQPVLRLDDNKKEWNCPCGVIDLWHRC